MILQKVCVFLETLLHFINGINADNACAARKMEGKSVVCVCNATYCDTITRIPPAKDEYIIYMSTESGLRFEKSRGKLQPLTGSDSARIATLELHPHIEYQTVEGYGGSVTDAAAINWKNLSEPLQKYLIDSYFGDNGLQYNMVRTPIGGSDFSTHAYSYNEYPHDDVKLTNFSLTSEDYQFKIPMIKAIMQASSTPVHIIATTWSPPNWMKTDNVYAGRNNLKPEYYQTYADYHIKFLEKYLAEGIPIWAITTTNEPTSGLVGVNSINKLGWNAKDMGTWIVNNLGPTIRNSTTMKNVKILTSDDQRLTLPYWANWLIMETPKVLDYIDGLAVHYYTDMITPAVVLTEVALLYPNKFIISTEACEDCRCVAASEVSSIFSVSVISALDVTTKPEYSSVHCISCLKKMGYEQNDAEVYFLSGTMIFEKHHVDLGSWIRAKKYIIDIIDDMNHQVVGWIDWNMCLNAEGGPNYISNFADSPIIVFPDKEEFIKEPMFYAMGHFAKFVPRGSKRIKVTHRNWETSVWNVAFVTPRNSVVVVLYNDGKASKVRIHLEGKQAVVDMEANTIATVELPYKRK